MGLDGPGPVTDANITVPPENQTNKCHNFYIKIMQKRIWYTAIKNFGFLQTRCL